MTDGLGDDIPAVRRADADATSAPATPFDPSAGDEWGTVLAVAGLVVGLIVVVLLLGGG